jgi:putative transcription factor
VVCPNCARRGAPIGPAPESRRAEIPRTRSARESNPELEVDPDYHSIIRLGREKLGLTQEQLGRVLNVKPSVISHLETGKMKPDIVLARKLMHQLRVNLLVPSSELDSAGQS